MGFQLAESQINIQLYIMYSLSVSGLQMLNITLLHFLIFSHFFVHIHHSPHHHPQRYVQDALREQLSETVYQCLREQGGHIYVCGDVTMAGDVLKTIQQIIKQQGNMSLEDAGVFISKLRVREEKKRKQ